MWENPSSVFINQQVYGRVLHPSVHFDHVIILFSISYGVRMC